MRQGTSGLSVLKIALLAGSAMVPPALARADAADVAAASAPASGTAVQEVVVTGFRKSLESAINLKRTSIGAVDAVIAEDIAKFPDQNLAESLQRIPGVAITRDGGEGRQITVRGLGSQFTVTRVNGLPAQAASMLAGSGGGANRDRSFDFNIFGSELFRSLVIHKTSEASIDEGSLGAVVDLNTGHPLGAKTGFTGLASVGLSYNDLSGQPGPRLAALANWKTPDGTLGFNASLAYTQGDTLELGNNTTRWAQAAFKSVTLNGATTNCFSGSNYVHSAACDQATLAFHPRIPRYGVITHDRERLGITSSIEWQPSPHTHVEVDELFSQYHEDRSEEWLEVLFRSNEKNINVVNPVYDSTGNMISGTFNNAYDRQEHYLQVQSDSFYQFSTTITQDITDRMRVNLVAGASKSEENIPLATTLMLDNKTAQNYAYDYTDMRHPLITFGTSVTDPANFQLAEIRDAPTNTVNKFKTVELNGEYDLWKGFKFKAGGVFRQFDFATQGGNRNTLVCPTNGKPDAVLGTLTCSSSVYGFPVNAGMVDTVHLGSAGQPAGTTGAFIVADLPAGTAFTNLYSRPVVQDVSNTRSVTEKDEGFYVQVDGRSSLFGIDYAVSGGVRYVRTEQSSTGLQTVGAAVNPVTVGRSYDDWLPSFNLDINPIQNVTVRFAIAQVMTRPSLGNLTPGGSVDSFNFKVSYGNPYLSPYRATNYDVALEWYFAPQSLFSVGLFHKDIESFPVSTITTGTFASTGLPTSILSAGSPAAQNPEAQPWTISTIGNGAGAQLQGIELGLQAPFRFLPGFFNRFGVILNATFAESTANYSVSGPATTITGTGGVTLTPSTVSGTFFGLSKETYNATLYYEHGPFSARASYSYRGPYVDQNSATGNIFEGFAGYGTLDAALRYSLTKRVELSIDASNLSDSYMFHYTDLGARRNYESYHVGRTIVFGARLKM